MADLNGRFESKLNRITSAPSGWARDESNLIRACHEAAGASLCNMYM